MLWMKFNPKDIKNELELIENLKIENGEISEKSLLRDELLNDHKFLNYFIKINFSSNLNYINFPFNDHEIDLKINNYNFT